MHKRFGIVLLFVLLAFLAGCGKGDVTHEFVTETVAATCTSAGSVKIYCGICGEIESETRTAALGHDFRKSYWPSTPTCRAGGDYTLKCSRCNELGGSGQDPALPHSYDSGLVTLQPTCELSGYMVCHCTECGSEKGEEIPATGDHDWIEVTGQQFNPETFVWENVTYTRCRNCSAQKNESQT